MTKYDMIIGIDPDKDKSGVAVLSFAKGLSLQLTNLTFPKLLDFLQKEKGKAGENGLCVVVEAGWAVKKSNFHNAQGFRAQKIAKDVGANHETGRKIVEMCRHYGIEVTERTPLRKCWRGRDGKITAEELEAFTGYGRRSNQDARDAALIAWTFAGLPIRIR